MSEVSQIGGGNPAGVDRTGNEYPVAAGVPHPLEISPSENPATSKQPYPRKTMSDHLEHSEIGSTPRSNPPEIEHQKRRDSGRDCLLGQARRIRRRSGRVMHGGVKNRGSELEIEAEHQTRGANDLYYTGQIGKRVERLEADHNLAGAAGKHLEGAACRVRACVHQQRAGKPGVKLGQLPKQRCLERPTLDGIQISHVTLVYTESVVEGAEQRNRVAGMVRSQTRCQGGVARSIPSLGVYSQATGQVQYRNDLHAPYPIRTS